MWPCFFKGYPKLNLTQLEEDSPISQGLCYEINLSFVAFCFTFERDLFSFVSYVPSGIQSWWFSTKSAVLNWFLSVVFLPFINSFIILLIITSPILQSLYHHNDENGYNSLFLLLLLLRLQQEENANVTTNKVLWFSTVCRVLIPRFRHPSLFQALLVSG